jgi:hypothetical protein
MIAVHQVRLDVDGSGHGSFPGNIRLFVGARVKPGHDGKIMD